MYFSHVFSPTILQSIKLFLVIIFWSFLNCTCSDLQWYNTCGSSFNCGNISQVGFPFWGGSTRSDKCGYPDLELTCEDATTTIIHIKGMRFHVLEVNQKTQMLTLARDDYLQGVCLQNLINTTFDFGHYDYGPDSQNITVLYGCPPPYTHTDAGNIPGQFVCKISGVSDTAAYPVEGAIGPSGCYASVVIPVFKASIEQLGNWSLTQVIANGFEAKYKLEDEDLVTTCGESGGSLGFDVTKKETCCLCPDGSVRSEPCTKPKASPNGRHPLTKSKIVILASISGLGIGICTIIVLILYFKRRCSSRKRQDVEVLLKKHGSLGPKRYTYSDLKRITRKFNDKLGEGGYGVVYKGKLHNGHEVAVKILKKSSKGNVEEFINEVASIGNTNHINIVKLLGFCYEGKKRALMYNYMPNGSLEKFTYGRQNNSELLLWEKLFEIVVGVARGLEYLHRGCETRILHFDIKPRNILLDENFCPKISDFGLSKSCPQKESIISMSEARGTIGYIAPEVFFKSMGGVSHKSDVYSYGMLVLEMVGCRNNADVGAECSSEQYFPNWIYKQLEQVEELGDQEGILNSNEGQLRRKMVLVSLWCIQTNPMNRPNMTRVVEMLEGTLESLQIPPMPSLGSLNSHQNFSTISVGRLFQE